MTMSRFSIPVHRQTHRTLIGEYKSRHRLHLSVVSQHVRRKSLKGLKLRLTLISQSNTATVALLLATLPLGDPLPP